MTKSSRDGLIRTLIKSILREYYDTNERGDVEQYIDWVISDTCDIATQIDEEVDEIIIKELHELAQQVYDDNTKITTND